jgi:hypothetical protein
MIAIGIGRVAGGNESERFRAGSAKSAENGRLRVKVARDARLRSQSRLASDLAHLDLLKRAIRRQER